MAIQKTLTLDNPRVTQAFFIGVLLDSLFSSECYESKLILLWTRSDGGLFASLRSADWSALLVAFRVSLINCGMMRWVGMMRRSSVWWWS